ncbi:hypothetical protein UFOVP296_24 [uncultured Caudovirales phage]|uniref:Uncharacterized protein n=1 Tax=uncultured Caudovirales phage TaxID=2100421 RepID=A0A6J5RTQ9_9CAUD|nr:hypothetical protein UFOVP296_24 [uncultured Caudovirales phage]CAB4170146.1 hypothetical protein UFOVP912_43 [uncultured Caudovirales phage]CAB4199322.1 hypothetical protein UFOVP1334_31 [uncultured Caudovirales phage]
MKAVILTPSLHETLISGIANAYASKGMSPYWWPTCLQIKSGPNAGKIAVRMGDDLLSQAMIPGPNHRDDRSDAVKFVDLPDYTAIMDLIGNPHIVEVADGDLDLPPPWTTPLTGPSPQGPGAPED